MLKRRTFLERSGSLLAALGMSGGSFVAIADRYATALAQPAPRKHALLLGVNQYTGVDIHGNPWLQPLQGCLTDVEMQRELLQYRFGFAAGDIITLTDAQATRQAIIDVMLSELIEHGQPEDLVVIHFSGYGGQANAPINSGGQRSGLRLSSWVPTDSLIRFSQSGLVNDLVESTLTRLVQAIPAQNVVLTLDASHTLDGVSLNPALRSRSRLLTEIPEVRPAKIAWPQALNPSIDVQGGLKDSKAMVLRAAQLPDQPGSQAFETQWSGLTAGAFTYALTQQLWATTPPRQTYVDFGAVQCRLQQLTAQVQIPQQIGSSKVPTSGWAILPDGVEGVVTDLDESRQEVSIWLGGVDPTVLAYISTNTPLQLWPEAEPDDSSSSTYLQVRSREGLIAKAKLISENAVPPKLLPGQGVREVVRRLRSVGLTIALDANLDRIERVDATSAIASIPYISAVLGSDQQADCRLGRVPDQTTLELNTQSPNPDSSPMPVQTLASLSLLPGTLPQNHYGLLSPNRVPIAATLCSQDEAIAGATRRLIPHLQTLLAAKLLRLLVNPQVSQLGLLVTLTWVTDQQSSQVIQETSRASALTPTSSPVAAILAIASASTDPQNANNGSSMVPHGAKFHLQVNNPSHERVYILLLGLDPVSGQMVYFPTMLSPAELTSAPTSSSLESSLLAQVLLPNQRSHYPTSPVTQAWTTTEKPGQYGLYLIASRAPLTQTWQKLSKQVSLRAALQETSVPLNNTLAIAQALLQDLDQASLLLSSPALLNALKESSIAEEVALHVGAWAGFEFSYTVSS